jgi:hypothetical protein
MIIVIVFVLLTIAAMTVGLFTDQPALLLGGFCTMPFAIFAFGFTTARSGFRVSVGRSEPPPAKVRRSAVPVRSYEDL